MTVILLTVKLNDLYPIILSTQYWSREESHTNYYSNHSYSYNNSCQHSDHFSDLIQFKFNGIFHESQKKKKKKMFDSIVKITAL